MKYIFALFCFLILNIQTQANSIHVGSEYINNTLVPCIYINGKIALKVFDKGIKNEFHSAFERAQYIAETLIDLQDKKQNISKIYIRYEDKTYYAYIRKRKLFAIGPADLEHFQIKSGFELAKQWRSSIKENLNLSSINQPEENQKEFLPKHTDIPIFITVVSIINSILIILLLLFSYKTYSKLNKHT